VWKKKLLYTVGGDASCATSLEKNLEPS
jgi:hypothetical protein